MSRVSLQSFFLALAALFIHGVASKSADPRISELDKLAGKHGGLIPLTDKTFTKYLLDEPRGYHAFVLYTHDHGVCTKCRASDPEFEVVAHSYLIQTDSEGKGSDGDAYFFVAAYQNNKEAFTKLKMSVVPVLYYHAPNVQSTAEDFLNENQKHDFYRSGSDADYLADFVQYKSGIVVTIYRSPLAKIAIVLTFLVFLGIVGFFVFSNFNFLLRIAREKSLWMLVSITLYMISISGMIYCVIRNPPLMHHDPRTKSTIFFHPQSRQQFVLEGLIVGAMNVLAALCVIMLAEKCPKLYPPEIRPKFAALGIGGFTFFYLQYVAVYRAKNPWY